MAHENEQTGNYDKAIKYFSAARADDDSLSTYCEERLTECRHHRAQELYNAGVAAFNLGDFRDAILSLKSAALVDPTFGPGHG